MYIGDKIFQQIDRDIKLLTSSLNKKREFINIELEDLLVLVLGYEIETYYSDIPGSDFVNVRHIYKKNNK